MIWFWNFLSLWKFWLINENYHLKLFYNIFFHIIFLYYTVVSNKSSKENKIELLWNWTMYVATKYFSQKTQKLENQIILRTKRTMIRLRKTFYAFFQLDYFYQINFFKKGNCQAINYFSFTNESIVKVCPIQV